MDYATLKREAAKYPDTMTSMERMKAYAMGEVVDHIPFRWSRFVCASVRLYIGRIPSFDGRTV